MFFRLVLKLQNPPIVFYDVTLCRRQEAKRAIENQGVTLRRDLIISDPSAIPSRAHNILDASKPPQVSSLVPKTGAGLRPRKNRVARVAGPRLAVEGRQVILTLWLIVSCRLQHYELEGGGVRGKGLGGPEAGDPDDRVSDHHHGQPITLQLRDAGFD